MSANVNSTVLEDPKVAKFLFSDTRMAWVWLPIRLWLGYQWISAAEHKLTDPKWMQTGEALKGFWMNGLKTDPKPVIAVDWYRSFIQFMVDSQAYIWFGKLVAIGEFMIGLGLILGAFVGIAAFFGGFMNWNFIMAGTASTNGLLFALAVIMILAWKNAGWIGLDRFLLPVLGTPWKPGVVFNRSRKPETRVA